MQLDDYTTENIAACLGLRSFAEDPALMTAVRAFRIMLKPSFHPEVCVTFISNQTATIVSVIAARTMVWRQRAPHAALTDQANGLVRDGFIAELEESLSSVIAAIPFAGIAIDGMTIDVISFHGHSKPRNWNGNVATSPSAKTLISQALHATWHSLDNPFVQNALAQAAGYAGLELPTQNCPERKPTVKTMILGAEEDRQQVAEALKRQHES